MKNIALSVLLIPVLLGAGCRSVKTQRAELNVPLTLAAGQTVSFEGEPLQLSGLELISDSRCASDVVCIRAGEALVRVHIQHDTQDLWAFTFATAPSDLSSNVQVVGPYRLELKDVQPYPRTDTPIAPDQIRAIFVVEKP